jgi:hypothetical protein
VTAVIGQGAIEVLMAPPESLLAGWLRAVRQDNIQRLASEVQVGGSTLLVTGRLGVVRCVPLVVLRMHRQDGRVLVRMRLASKADGSQEATCKLPGCKQEAGEHPDGCLKRLLEGKLKALTDSIVVVGVERQSQQDNSRKFGVPTRYVRTVVSAEWQESPEDSGPLGKFTVSVADSMGPHLSNASSHSPSRRRATVERTPSLPADVVMLPADAGFYAWVTEDQFAFFRGAQGQQSLFRWISRLYQTLGVNPASDRPDTPTCTVSTQPLRPRRISEEPDEGSDEKAGSQAPKIAGGENCADSGVEAM